MQKSKKIISLLLAMLMILSALPLGGFVGIHLPTLNALAEEVTSGKAGDNVTWSFDKSTGTLTLSGTGAAKIFPDGFFDENSDNADKDPGAGLPVGAEFEADSLGVKMIPWYSYMLDITSIVVDEGITELGGYLFVFLINAKTISLPSTLLTIGKEVFIYCLSLKELVIPEGVTTIEESEIYNEESEIDKESFLGYFMDLETLVLPDSLKCESLGFYAPRLKSLTIPEGIENVIFENYCLTLTELINKSATASVDIYNYGINDCDYINFEYFREYYIDLLTEISHNFSYSGDYPDMESEEYISQYNAHYGKNYSSIEEMELEYYVCLGQLLFQPTIYCTENSEQHRICTENFIKHHIIGEETECASCYDYSEKSGSFAASDDSENIFSWTFDAATRTLTVSGSGEFDASAFENDDFYNAIGYTGIENLIFSEGITEITGSGGMELIKNISIPSTCTYVDPSAVNGFFSENITVADGNTKYFSEDGVVYGNTEDGEIYLAVYPGARDVFEIDRHIDYFGVGCFCGGLVEFEITDKSAYAFFPTSSSETLNGVGCGYLGKLIVSDDIDLYASYLYAVYYCRETWISEVDVTDDCTKYAVKDGVLYSKDYTELLYVPQSKLRNSFIIPENVNKVCIFAFTTCYDFYSHDVCRCDIEIENSNCEIADGAFYNCILYAEPNSTAQSYVIEGEGKSNGCAFVAKESKEIKNVAIKSMPTTTEYKIGDKISCEGLTLLVTYADGTTAERSVGYTCDINNEEYYVFNNGELRTFELDYVYAEKAGTQTVTVDYCGFKISFDITVSCHTFCGAGKTNADGTKLYLCKTCGEYLVPESRDYFEGIGTYPQTMVTDESLVASLTSKAGSTDNWKSYNYYISGEQSDFMKYTDIELNGEKYRGVYFTSYRPYFTTGDGITRYQQCYSTNTVYWFKYEPVIWQILSYDAKTDTLKLMSRDILDSQEYYDNNEIRTINETTIYPNNYEYSNIRKWRNETFYNTAFTSSEKSAIVKTTLDNSAYSTSYSEYDSNSTTDNIWVLSYDEVLNADYGFSDDAGNCKARASAGSDYADVQGVSSKWRLRSAGYDYNRACTVYSDGYVYSHLNVNITDLGVRPALTLNLKSEIYTSCEHSFVEKTVSATCSEGGCVLHTCSLCGFSYKTDITQEALGHSYSEKWTVDVASTCTEYGEATHHCTRCGESDNTSFYTISYTGHSYGEWETVKEATTTETGKRQKTCSVCKNVLAEDIEILDKYQVRFSEMKEFAEEISEPVTTLHIACPVDVKLYNDDGKLVAQVIANTPESFDDRVRCYVDGESKLFVFPTSMEYDVEITATGDGSMQFIVYEYADGAELTVNKFDVQTLATGDVFTSAIKPVADSTQNGYVLIKNNTEEIDSHTPTAAINSITELSDMTLDIGQSSAVQAAQYDLSKIKWYSNDTSVSTVGVTSGLVKAVATGSTEVFGIDSSSGLVLKMKITVRDHEYGEGVLSPAPTCDTAGKLVYTCKNCGATKSETVDALGHDFGEWTQQSAPTCTSDGTEIRVCKNDPTHTETRSVSKAAHSDADSDGLCDDCGADLGTKDPTENCSCKCHKTKGIVKFFWKILNFFNKIFKKNQYCTCGAKHW